MEPAQHAAIALATPTEAALPIIVRMPPNIPQDMGDNLAPNGVSRGCAWTGTRAPAALSARCRLIIGREYKIEFGGMEFRKRLTSFFRRQQRCRLNALAQPGVAFGEGNRRHIQSENLRQGTQLFIGAGTLLDPHLRCARPRSLAQLNRSSSGRALSLPKARCRDDTRQFGRVYEKMFSVPLFYTFSPRCCRNVTVANRRCDTVRAVLTARIVRSHGLYHGARGGSRNEPRRAAVL